MRHHHYGEAMGLGSSYQELGPRYMEPIQSGALYLEEWEPEHAVVQMLKGGVQTLLTDSSDSSGISVEGNRETFGETDFQGQSLRMETQRSNFLIF